jgi:hypothetical protein
MYVVYFDEVKHEPPHQDSYWIGGLAVEIGAMLEIEKKISAIARAAFGSDRPMPKTELHAKDIFHGKGNCKGKSIQERLDILSQLGVITMDADNAGALGRIYARIIPANMVVTSNNPAEVAFMYFIEQVDEFLEKREAAAIVIGDYDNTTSTKSVADLAFFKSHQTHYRPGKKIKRIVDCVHYVQSHHSRLIQIADHFMWSTQMAYAPHNERYMRKKYQQILNEQKLPYTPWSRVWPQEKVWYRR